MTRHGLLAHLHELLKPATYLETGVQYGESLSLAIHSKVAIGIDPYPLIQARGNQQIHRMLSDEFFLYHMAPEEKIDLAFIDGSHKFEDALRDFINIELHCHEKTIAVFDDVLPLNEEMTSRAMIPGYWTGDVWKITPALRKHRPDLKMILVDTEPTGTLIVFGLNHLNRSLPLQYTHIVDGLCGAETMPVPDEIISRQTAVPGELAIRTVEKWLNSSKEGDDCEARMATDAA